MQDNKSTTTKVPLALLKTWVWMVTESRDPEVIAQGTEKLIQEFGSLMAAQKFIEKCR